MCKHVTNAAASVRFPCCLKFFDCIECHDEYSGHPAKYAAEMVFQCKTCDRCFRKDLRHFGPPDEECPHCGEVYVKEAETPAQQEGQELEMEALKEKAAAASAAALADKK